MKTLKKGMRRALLSHLKEDAPAGSVGHGEEAELEELRQWVDGEV